ncbi:MAG: glycosyltransferase family 39 protein [Actinomycetota bacterium]|nr:glycosyltransferase family 39 protein [Actinomycetota bacterium]
MLRHGLVSESEPGVRPRTVRGSTGSSRVEARSRSWRWLLVATLLAGAFLVRLDGIATPSLYSRELQSALLARQYYLGDGDGLPAWKQHVVRELGRVVRPLEPPVLDVLAGSVFRLVGGEYLWIPRLASIGFWLLGGVFLFLIATRVTRPEGALIALALYLFWPYPAFISRLYQPDAMMMALLLAAALTIIRYWERPSPARLGTAGIVSAVATVAKPGIAFIFLLGLFIAIAVSRRALVTTVVQGRLPLFVTLALLPFAVYYVYGVYVRGFLAGQGEGWIDPTKLWTAWFWEGWWEMVSFMLVFPQHQTYAAVVPLGAALLGIAVSRGFGRAILLGLLFAYIVFAFTLTVPIATHAYYSLPLIPTLSISIGALAVVVANRLRQHVRLAPAAVFTLAALAISIGVYKTHAVLTPPPPLRQIADYQRIGEVTGHTTRAIYVDMLLRSPISYWGWIVGSYWYPPTPAQDLPASADPFPSWIDAAKADFLIVVETSELETEKRLRAFIRHLPVVERTERYAIFDLRGGRAVAAERRSRRGGQA